MRNWFLGVQLVQYHFPALFGFVIPFFWISICIYLYIYIYYIEPKWPLFWLERALFQGWSPKIEDKQVPGIYSFTPSPGHSFSPSESFRRQTDSQLPAGEAIDVQVKFIGNPGAKCLRKWTWRVYTWRMGPDVVFEWFRRFTSAIGKTRLALFRGPSKHGINMVINQILNGMILQASLPHETRWISFYFQRRIVLVSGSVFDPVLREDKWQRLFGFHGYKEQTLPVLRSIFNKEGIFFQALSMLGKPIPGDLLFIGDYTAQLCGDYLL